MKPLVGMYFQTTSFSSRALLKLFAVFYLVLQRTGFNQQIFIKTKKMEKLKECFHMQLKESLINGQVEHSDTHKHTYQSAKTSI